MYHLKEMQDYLSKEEGFIKHNNIIIKKIKEGYAEAECPILEQSLNPYGMVHGGLIFGLADTTCGLAAKSLNKEAVTLDSTISYLNPAKKGKLLAKAQLVKDGKHIGVYEVNIYNNKIYVAKCLLTFYYSDKK